VGLDRILFLSFWVLMLVVTLSSGIYEILARKVVWPQWGPWGPPRSGVPARVHGTLLLVFSVIAATWILLLSGVARDLRLQNVAGGFLIILFLLLLIGGAILSSAGPSERK
jgi:hypothetical protein